MTTLPSAIAAITTARSLAGQAVADPRAAIKTDLGLPRSNLFLPAGIVLTGLLYGRVERMAEPEVVGPDPPDRLAIGRHVHRAVAMRCARRADGSLLTDCTAAVYVSKARWNAQAAHTRLLVGRAATRLTT